MGSAKEKFKDMWTDEAWSNLDQRLEEASQYLEEDESMPPPLVVKAAKDFLFKCASHLKLDQPEIRFSPNGDIYLTWVVDGWQHIMCFTSQGKIDYYTDYKATDYLPELAVFRGFVESQAA